MNEDLHVLIHVRIKLRSLHPQDYIYGTQTHNSANKNKRNIPHLIKSLSETHQKGHWLAVREKLNAATGVRTRCPDALGVSNTLLPVR